MARRRSRSKRQATEDDLELLPLMNLFVVLIPMLLLSAVFIELAVIKMNLPSDEATPPKSEAEKLGLSIAITDEQFVVKGRRLPTTSIDRATEDAEERLRGTLAGLTEQYPEEHAVVILSQAETRYDDIVSVMDVSRETGFGNISLSGGSQ
jgi:biopolymer transport protein ExbD